MKVIVLCGGLGTRLGELTRRTPKPMLEVAGRPFIAHVLDRLCVPGVDGIVLAAGFGWEQLHSYVGDTWRTLPVTYSVESRPLGTGGALALAMNELQLPEALVVNGDTLFDIDLPSFIARSAAGPGEASVTWLALRHVHDCTRYGRVEMDGRGRLRAFGEKGHPGPGWINGGIYRQQRGPLQRYGAEPFSFEVDYLSREYGRLGIMGIACEGYFIDIGIPDDLERAKTELTAMAEGRP